MRSRDRISGLREIRDTVARRHTFVTILENKSRVFCRNVVEIMGAKDFFPSSCIHLAYVCIVIDAPMCRNYWRSKQNGRRLMASVSYILRSYLCDHFFRSTFFLLQFRTWCAQIRRIRYQVFYTFETSIQFIAGLHWFQNLGLIYLAIDFYFS